MILQGISNRNTTVESKALEIGFFNVLDNVLNLTLSQLKSSQYIHNSSNM